MTSIVLAGGRSLRLGRDKILEKVGGESLIQRVISRLECVSTEILIAIVQDQPLPSLKSSKRVRIVFDLYPGMGSLGGVYTGLSLSNSFSCFVVACDMPFLNIALIQYLMRFSPTFDVVVPRVQGKVEPLHAFYSKNCLKPIERLLGSGNLKIIDFFDEVKVRYIEESEIDKYDPEHISFFNINTHADLDIARNLAERGQN